MTENRSWQRYLLRVINGDETGFGAKIACMCLTGLEFTYRVLSGLKFMLIRRYRLPVPVISIGNITVGGTGKTPTVIWLVKTLKAAGLSPVILTRGYGGACQKEGLIFTSRDLAGLNAAATGDEPFLLAKLLPDTLIAAGRERYRNALKALTINPAIDLFILDDGFQHWSLARDLDIVIIDASRPFGNRRLLPRGFLREPLSSLKRAGVVLLTRTAKADGGAMRKITEEILAINPEVAVAKITEATSHLILLTDFVSGQYGTLIPAAEFLKGRKVGAITGIGNPRQFLASLENMGAEVGYFKAYPDHYNWAKAEITDLVRGLAESAFREIIITAKDAVKLEKFTDSFVGHKLSCYVLSLEFTVSDQRIVEKVKTATGRPETVNH